METIKLKILDEAGHTLIRFTHDLGSALPTADAVAVVAHGKVLECRPAAEFFPQAKTATSPRYLPRILKS